MSKEKLIQRMNKVLTEKDFKEIEEDEMNNKKLEEIIITDRWGQVVPMAIEEKRNWIEVFSNTFRTFDPTFPGLFSETEGERKENE